MRCRHHKVTRQHYELLFVVGRHLIVRHPAQMITPCWLSANDFDVLRDTPLFLMNGQLPSSNN